MSLKKDRRADWWKDDHKGARSQARSRSHQIARRENQKELADAPDVAEARFQLRQRKRWKKDPGVTLGDHIRERKQTRASKHGARLRRKMQRASVKISRYRDQ